MHATHPILFVGAGPGDPELITVKGQKALAAADLVVYAGSLVPEALLRWTRPGTPAVDSAPLDLEAIVAAMARAQRQGQRVVRLHTGDPALYGAICEQLAALRREGIACRIVPGVTSALAAAAALGLELTLPGVSQTLILTRAAGRTPVPPGESLRSLATHGATLAIYLSAGLMAQAAAELLEVWPPHTPCMVAYRVSQPGERLLRTRLGEVAERLRSEGIGRQAVILVGPALDQEGAAEETRSLLYDPAFDHGFRKGRGLAEGDAETVHGGD
jgi:precorrin-4/cobalt-precorrin-4 C11-methyltransferase